MGRNEFRAVFLPLHGVYSMKKLMILGAGASQVPLILAARRLGYEAIVASIPGEYPGFAYADQCCYADISKPEEVLAKAKELNIDGITTCGMDTGIRAIGKVCDELGLRGISYEAACTFSNKYFSKLACEKAGVPCAKAFQIRTEEELLAALEKLVFPVVVKAVDLMGSRGVYRCDTKEEALAAFAGAMENTSSEYCLVEEFLEGLMFGAEGLLTDGKLEFCLPYGTDLYYQSTIPTSIGHFAPFTEDIQKEAEQTLTAALTGAGARNTPFNCDLVLKDGKIYVIEINGRAGASGLSDTVGIYYGLNYYEILCRQAMGEETKSAFHLENGKGHPSISRMLTAPKNGILEKIELPKEAEDADVSIDLNVHPSDPVRVYQIGRDRLGLMIVKGNSVEVCREKMNQVLRGIRYEIR